MKKRVPRWVIPLISASGNGAGAGAERGGEVPPRGQLHNVLALSTRVGEGRTKEVKKLHSCPLGRYDRAGRQADKHTTLTEACIWPLSNMSSALMQ